MKLTAISVAWVFALSFYAAAAVGFVPNPLLGPDGLFVANTAHNLVHLLTAVGFTAVALAGTKPSVAFMRAFGAIYALTGVIGFLATGFGGHGHEATSILKLSDRPQDADERFLDDVLENRLHEIRT